MPPKFSKLALQQGTSSAPLDRRLTLAPGDAACISTFPSSLDEVGFVPADPFQRFMTESMIQLNNRLGPLERTVAGLEDQLASAAGSHASLSHRLGVIEQGIALNQANLTKLKEHANDQERRARRFNLRFLGIPEAPNENPLAVMETLLAKHGVDVRLSIAHRCGKFLQVIPGAEPPKPRPMIIKVALLRDRDAIIGVSKQLREDDGISVLDDLTRSDYVKKKAEWPLVKALLTQTTAEGGRGEGQTTLKASFKNGKWFVNGVSFNNPSKSD